MRYYLFTLGLALFLSGAAPADLAAQWRAALAARDLAGIERLLERDINPDWSTRDGVTALMLAARVANLSLLNKLIEAGAAVNAENDRGGTALMYAVISAQPEAVSALLQHGAKPDIQASNGWTALIIASAKGYMPILERMLEVGADPTRTDIYGWTALMRAAHSRRAAVVERLLEHDRVDPNTRNDNGSTALHLAAAIGEAGICKTLLAAGARRDITNQAGYTPGDLADKAGHASLATLLRR